MTDEPRSFKKVAVLTGLTALIGGAEISNADAATVSQRNTFGFSPSSVNLSFKSFNALGISGELTGVTLNLVSHVFLPAFTSATTSVDIFSTPFPSTPNPVPFNNATAFGATDVNDFTLNGVSGNATLADYINSNFNAVLTLTGGSGVLWTGTGPEGLTVTYTYTATPLPATLPLFVGGLAGLGFTAWRSRRKQTPKE
jgi:hypothetical protein